MKHGMIGLWLAIMLLLSGCESADDEACARLPGGARYCLQPSTAMAPFDVQQKVDVSMGEQRETMIVELEVDARGMRLVGITPLGYKLIEAGFDNAQVTTTVWPDKRLDPALLFSLLQITLWPADTVQRGFGATAVLEENAATRRVIGDGKVVVNVGYTGDRLPLGNAHIVLPQAKLELDVTNLDGEETQ